MATSTELREIGGGVMADGQVFELHQGGDDAAARRALYERRAPVQSAEVARLYTAAQRALEDLALALGPLDSYRSSVITIANVCRSNAKRIEQEL